MKRKIQTFILALSIVGCTQFDDAEPTDRKSFVRFYSNTTSYSGVVAEEDTDGGYIIGGIVGVAPESHAILIKTDNRGNKLWETIIKNGTLNSIKPISTGYLVLGDSIELNEGVEEVSEIVNYRARLLKMTNQGTLERSFVKSDSVYANLNTDDPDTLQVDYHGEALAFDNANNLLVLGSFQEPGKNKRSFVSALNPNTFTPIWVKSYGLSDRDYENCRSLYVTPSSKLVWASRAYKAIQNLSTQYVSISVVEPNSTFENNSLLGENDARNHSIQDLQISLFGFGAIGTYMDQNGGNANIFFTKVDRMGNLMGSPRYYDVDAILSDPGQPTDFQDHGQAITAVEDGFLLAGNFTSTPTKGNGGEDIILLRVDQDGEIIWTKVIGGSGDEKISSVRYTTDGSFLICGTNTIKGLSSIMLIKVDKNGELVN